VSVCVCVCVCVSERERERETERKREREKERDRERVHVFLFTLYFVIVPRGFELPRSTCVKCYSKTPPPFGHERTHGLQNDVF